METKYYCENCEWELIDNTYAECPAWICDNCGCIELSCQGYLEQIHNEYVNAIQKNNINDIKRLGNELIKIAPPKNNIWITLTSHNIKEQIVINHYEILSYDYERIKEKSTSVCFSINNKEYIITIWPVL